MAEILVGKDCPSLVLAEVVTQMNTLITNLSSSAVSGGITASSITLR